MKRCLFAALFPLAAAQAEETAPPRWDAGVGFGYLRFEHYPASNQDTSLAFPFPTFSYRGSVLRADDRDGAKLFLVKRPGWVLQSGGLGFPPLSSSTNTARKGMPDQEVHALYYEVRNEQATPDRPAYASGAGVPYDEAAGVVDKLRHASP